MYWKNAITEKCAGPEKTLERCPIFALFKKPLTSSETKPLKNEFAYEAKTSKAKKPRASRFSRKKLKKLKVTVVCSGVDPAAKRFLENRSYFSGDHFFLR